MVLCRWSRLRWLMLYAFICFMPGSAVIFVPIWSPCYIDLSGQLSLVLSCSLGIFPFMCLVPTFVTFVCCFFFLVMTVPSLTNPWLSSAMTIFTIDDSCHPHVYFHLLLQLHVPDIIIPIVALSISFLVLVYLYDLFFTFLGLYVCDWFWPICAYVGLRNHSKALVVYLGGAVNRSWSKITRLNEVLTKSEVWS